MTRRKSPTRLALLCLATTTVGRSGQRALVNNPDFSMLRPFQGRPAPPFASVCELPPCLAAGLPLLPQTAAIPCRVTSECPVKSPPSASPNQRRVTSERPAKSPPGHHRAPRRIASASPLGSALNLNRLCITAGPR
ncbi:hypothetical protein VPH35_110277 [Triticum aestivum]